MMVRFLLKILYIIASSIFILLSLSANASAGTIWEDMHIVTKKHCSDIADVMTVEDFDEFASAIYITSGPNNIDKKIVEWLCALKAYQAEQNYLSIISAQELGIKPLVLPLLQLNENILAATHQRKYLSKKINQIITILEFDELYNQDQKSLNEANIDLPFHKVHYDLERITMLFLLQHANSNVADIRSNTQEIKKLLKEISILQKNINSGLDNYKLKIDVLRSKKST